MTMCNGKRLSYEKLGRKRRKIDKFKTGWVEEY